MNLAIILLHLLAYTAVAQEAVPETTPTLALIPPNRKQPIISPNVDIVMGAISPEATHVNIPTGIPSNRKQPVTRPNLDTIMGALPPGSVPASRPSPAPPVHPNSVISKADVVMAVIDSMGTIVNNLAENLSGDLNDVFKKPAVPPDNRDVIVNRVMEMQNGVRDQVGDDSLSK